MQIVQNLILALITAGQFVCVSAQELPSPEVPESKPILTVRALRTTLKALGEERSTKQKELSLASTVEEKQSVSGQLRDLNEKIASLNAELESVVTGIDVESLDERLGVNVEFDEEFRDLLRPIVHELKRATAKPRELEQLRTAEAFHKRRKATAEKALVHLREMIATTKDEEIVLTLRNMEKTWEARLEQYTNELTTASYQLEERINSEESLFGTLRDGANTFMRTRGKNILVAALAMTAVFLLLRFGHRKVRYLPIFRGKGKSFGARLLDVVYYGVTILLAVLAGILALYLLGDWLLLGLSAILLAGIVWASKATLPKFFEQTKLMLNLGSAREGERVIYAGVPWEIKEIGIFSDLVNPALEGGHVRVPLRDLVPLVSRHFGKREPFFPTATGNWVILADATLGKVIRQTPECVQLVLLGSTIKTYTVDDFLGQMPRNLSLGFRLSVTFGIDYSHQKIATTGVPAILLDRVQSGLPRLVGEQNIVNIGVEFANAGASSLDYVVQADFTGDVAEKYFQIERAIQRICVETCNESGWVIPFTQVTMHYANPTESPSFILKEDAGS